MSGYVSSVLVVVLFHEPICSSAVNVEPTVGVPERVYGSKDTGAYLLIYIEFDAALLFPTAFVAVIWQIIYLSLSADVVTYVLDVAPDILE